MNSGDQRDLGNEMRSILLAHFPPLSIFGIKKIPQICLLQTSLLFSEQHLNSQRAGELWQGRMRNTELETINIFYCWRTKGLGTGAVCFLLQAFQLCNVQTNSRGTRFLVGEQSKLWWAQLFSRGLWSLPGPRRFSWGVLDRFDHARCVHTAEWEAAWLCSADRLRKAGLWLLTVGLTFEGTPACHLKPSSPVGWQPHFPLTLSGEGDLCCLWKLSFQTLHSPHV